MLRLFSHTCQTWSQSTRLQTTESHTHGSFQRDAPTRLQPGIKRGTVLYFQGPSLSCPGLITFCFCFFFFFFFLAKVILSNHKIRCVCPQEWTFFPVGTHARPSITWPSGTDLQNWACLWLPKKKTNEQKTPPNLGRDILGFLLLNMNTHDDMFAQGCVSVQKPSACVWSVWMHNEPGKGGGGVHIVNGTGRTLTSLMEQASIHRRSF